MECNDPNYPQGGGTKLSYYQYFCQNKKQLFKNYFIKLLAFASMVFLNLFPTNIKNINAFKLHVQKRRQYKKLSRTSI